MKKILGLIAAVLLISTAYGHEHKPPHGGTLVEFGEEFAHLELVLDAKEGKLSGYTLDGEAENPVRVKQSEIVLLIKLPGAAEPAKVTLNAFASVLSGEKEGDTSQFEGQADALKGSKLFDALVSVISIKGKEFKNVKFNFPKGNE